jgi:ketosteroid isomerase-like protein
MALKTRISILAAALCLTAMPVAAQEPAPGSPPSQTADQRHEELRALRDGLIKATNESNVDALLALLHPNVVVTWQNAEVSRGRTGVKEYLTRMMSGPNRVVASFQTNPTVDELTILHGDDAGIAFGSSRDRFVLTSGMDFELNGRWSATMVREDGRWLVASFHASTNLFDNPVLNLTKRTTIWSGVVGLLLGALVGLLAGRAMRKRAA